MLRVLASGRAPGGGLDAGSTSALSKMQAPDDTTPPQEDTSMVSEPSAPLRYSVELFEAFGAVSEKAKAGVQSCQAVAAFVHERAGMEAAYARAISKIAAHANSHDWAPGFAQSWQLVQETLAGLGKLHTESATKMQSTMVAGARAFAAQQEIQVQRLVAEGTKIRTVRLNMIQTMERAKDKYERRCTEAAELVAAMQRRTDSMDGSPASSPSLSAMVPPSLASPPSTGVPAIETVASSDDSKEIVGQLLTKMWDTTSSFTKPSMERQRSKLESCLDELVVAEKQYTSSVEYVNSQRLVVEREIAENLHAFQLTEEQRIEYLKDLLLRLQKMLLRNVEASHALVEKLRDGANELNELVAIEDGFRQLGRDADPDTQLLDPTDNAFYQRMCQVQAMSDRGHHVVRVIASTITELMTMEDHFVASAQRLLRAHDAPASSTAGDLFNLSIALSQVCGEGPTMSAGWKATKEQTQRSWEVHLEFKSLLAEPVALNIATMRQEYETARVSTHETFSKTHATLCHDAATHQKLKQRLDAKSREFAQVFASLPDMGEIDLRNLDVTQVLVLVHQMASTFSEKEKRVEGKLKQVADDVREAQQKVNESLTAFKQRSAEYIQDVNVLISASMKNEKFRLQVEKSSLQALAKAFEHAVDSAAVGIHKAITALERIEPSRDVSEFVRAHRTPHEKSKKMTPSYHRDEALQAALGEYHRSRAKPPVATTEEAKSKRPVETTTAQPTPAKRTSSTPVVQGSAIEKTIKSAISSVMDEDKDPLMGMSDFQKKFKLENPEQIVESYSCALYANNFPNHGRMYLTTDHVCFAGWRDTVYVASYLDIVLMEKKNSAIIVPNAIEITTTNGEKAFFTSYVFRDECLQCIQQLQAIKKATNAAMADPVVVKPTISTESSEARLEAPADVPSPTTEVPVAPSPQVSGEPVADPIIAVAELEPQTLPMQTPAAPAAPSPPKPLPPVPRVIPDRDLLLSEFEVVVDEEVPFGVEFAHNSIWIESSAFFQQFLEAGGETSISIAPWEKTAVEYTAVAKPDTFDGSRCVTYTHNKKYMVGPSSIPTTQIQRFKWQPNIRLVISVTTVVTDAPYSDYFRAENRWVFSNTARDGVCRLQVGVGIQWLKSTWLKKQIESTAMGEAKEYTRALMAAAVDASKQASVAANDQVAASTTLATVVRASVGEDAPAEPSAAKPIQRRTSVIDTESPVVAKVVSGSVVKAAADMAASQPAATTPTTGQRTLVSQHQEQQQQQQQLDIKSLLQLANLVCLLLFIFTMYRIGSALDQMQVLTREALVQQRQQQELFREVLLKLHEQNNKT